MPSPRPDRYPRALHGLCASVEKTSPRPERSQNDDRGAGDRSIEGHSVLQPLNCAGAEPYQPGRLEHACALDELAASSLELLGVGIGTPEALTLLASLGDEVT